MANRITSPVNGHIYSASLDLILKSKKAQTFAQESLLQSLDDPSQVGEYLGAFKYESRLVAHYFESIVPGYKDWLWVVVLARQKNRTQIQLIETFLTPGEGALLPKPWVDWADRLTPEDANSYDNLPFVAEDPNLVPGFKESDRAKYSPQNLDQVRDLVRLYALSRARVLSPLARATTAQRWYQSEHGPKPANSRNFEQKCSTCGFWVPLQSDLGQAFGVCTTNWSRDDGKVVSIDHGCGAHSESQVTSIVDRYVGPALRLDDIIEYF
ncbi:MAG: DUF3027 domain-containing protein [Bifidobacteriaceae bacterium]|jgi:hypothetical protein|nr:DUF3027 domain-containing protein [Bifidobacteriaceae bacterium]